MDEDVIEINGSIAPSENTSSAENAPKVADELLVVESKDNINNCDDIKPVTSDGNHNELAPNLKEFFKNGQKKSQIPRIIANNFKPPKNTKHEKDQGHDRIEASPEKANRSENSDIWNQKVIKSHGRTSDIQGLRLKPSKDLINQLGKGARRLPLKDHVNDNETNKESLDSSSDKWHLESSTAEVESIEHADVIAVKDRSNKINKLRVIRPKIGSSAYRRRSASNDSSSPNTTDIGLKRNPKTGTNDSEGAATNKNNCFWEHKLLNYLSPRLNHPRSHTTNSKPISSRESTAGKNFGSCPIWIHLLVR